MGRIDIDVGAAWGVAEQLRLVAADLSGACKRVQRIAGDPNVASLRAAGQRLRLTQRAIADARQDIGDLSSAVRYGSVRYEEAENTVLGQRTRRTCDSGGSVSGFGPIPWKQLLLIGLFGPIAPGSPAVKFLKRKGWSVDYLTGEAKADWWDGASAKGTLMKIGQKWGGEGAEGEVRAVVGEGAAYAVLPTGATLFKRDSKTGEVTYTGVKAEVGASVSGLKVDAEGQLGDSDLGLTGSAGFALATASASAGASLRIDGEKGPEAYVSAKAGVAAARGHVTGGFNIFGLNISATAEGQAGALGAEAIAGYIDGRVKAKVGAAVLFGGSLEISIGKAPP